MNLIIHVDRMELLAFDRYIPSNKNSRVVNPGVSLISTAGVN